MLYCYQKGEIKMASAIRINSACVQTLRHIFDARIDHCDAATYGAWTTARDIVEYALANNFECLKEFDYLMTREDAEREEKYLLEHLKEMERC